MALPLPPAGSLVAVRVTPKASASRVKAEAQEDGTLLYRVYVTVAAEDGKANKAVIDLLAKAWGLRKSSLVLVRGHTDRNKLFRIET